MSKWFERYQQGYCQEVYGELLALQEQVFDDPMISDEARLVAREMMRRVRTNLEILVPRLKTLGYQFVDGDWMIYWEKKRNNKSLYSQEEQALLNDRLRIFRAPPTETTTLLDAVEQLAGTLPLVVRCWYEEVGSVNLIGTFPATKAREELNETLDPLLIIPIEDLIGQYPNETIEEWKEVHDEEGKIELELSVDAPLKYDRSGSGGYAIKTPCRTFNTVIDLIYYKKSYTFVNYLRTCFQFGGMFGLTKAQPGEGLTSEEIAFLTQGLLPF